MPEDREKLYQQRLSPSPVPEAWKQLPYNDQRVAERAKRIFDALREAAYLFSLN